jgi:hypothetical protein
MDAARVQFGQAVRRHRVHRFLSGLVGTSAERGALRGCSRGRSEQVGKCPNAGCTANSAASCSERHRSVDGDRTGQPLPTRLGQARSRRMVRMTSAGGQPGALARTDGRERAGGRGQARDQRHASGRVGRPGAARPHTGPRELVPAGYRQPVRGSSLRSSAAAPACAASAGSSPGRRCSSAPTTSAPGLGVGAAWPGRAAPHAMAACGEARRRRPGRGVPASPAS